jgi:hypothetical protein
MPVTIEYLSVPEIMIHATGRRLAMSSDQCQVQVEPGLAWLPEWLPRMFDAFELSS